MGEHSKGARFELTLQLRGGLPWIVAELEQGRSLRSLAREIGCGRWWLDRWVYADPRRRAGVSRARVAGAYGACASQGQADAAHVPGNEVPMAGWDDKAHGSQGLIDAKSIGAWHLDALRMAVLWSAQAKPVDENHRVSCS